MALTTQRTSRWRPALAAAGVSALVATALPVSASADTVDSTPAPKAAGTGLTLAPGARTAADPIAGQTNIGNRLASGRSLTGGQRISSPSGQYNVSMFDAEGLGRIPIMYSRTCGWVANPPLGSGHNGSTDTRLSMQSDGNLVTYQSGVPRWHSGTHGNPGAFFQVQNDGNLVVYSAAGKPLWNSGFHCDLIYTVENRRSWDESGLTDPLAMQPGDVIHSPNGSKRLLLQPDGNLVLYRGTTPLWSSGTHGNPRAFLRAQFDGNIVLYSAAGRPLWYTGSSWTNPNSGNEGYQLMVQDDGNLVNYHWNDISTAAVRVQWSSGTRG